MRSFPAGSATDRELVEPDRQARFQYLRIGEAAVRHMSLYRAGSVVIGPGPGTTRDRLVILVALVSEGEIVHRSLARRKPLRRCKQGVRDDLARFDISSDDRGRIFRVEH